MEAGPTAADWRAAVTVAIELGAVHAENCGKSRQRGVLSRVGAGECMLGRNRLTKCLYLARL